MALALLLTIPARAELPVGGRPVPGMAVFDSIMTSYMNANGITAGVLGISRNGRIEYMRSFGWLKEPTSSDPGVALPENAMMRTASCVKPITAAAIRQLSSEGGLGALGLSTNVFGNLVRGVSGLLNITPSPYVNTGLAQYIDSRSANITVSHLILHQGGFDRSTNPPGDVTFDSINVAQQIRVPSPPSTTGIMTYMLRWPLKWAPGTQGYPSPRPTDSYSNYGYMVLGEVLQAYAAGGYMGYVQNRIMSPTLWIPSTDFLPARSQVLYRNPREPGYISNNSSKVPSVFDNTQVWNPDGGFCVENMLAHGGVIASAQAMIRFANKFHIQYGNGLIGQPITAANPIGNSAYSGRLDGCNTWLQQRSDGIVFYLALNRTDFGNPDFSQVLGGNINNQISNGGFTWPNSSADGFWVAVGTENRGAGFGSYDSSFEGFQSAYDHVTDGSFLRLWGGRQSWTGAITKRLMLDAPEGEVTLGP
jgi:CubicO group peptidase (beta-lactamase class C family)